jgi:hypothetical protein
MHPTRSAGNARFNGVPTPSERSDRPLGRGAVIDGMSAAISTPESTA